VESIQRQAHNRYRAGLGMFNNLQDALGYRSDQNASFQPNLQPTEPPGL
jgi:hypothetical protein